MESEFRKGYRRIKGIELKARKGIILAGGSGTRLYPATAGLSKQLVPVYDKPMIYYPITTLMQSGIREIAIINRPEDAEQFERFLGDGSQWGLSFTYIQQPNPDGLAQAFILSKGFLDGAPSTLVLGDNIFYGKKFKEHLLEASQETARTTVFGRSVDKPERFGVLDFNEQGQVTRIIEKPIKPPSNYAVTGLYFVDETAPSRAKDITPSTRGELEITDLLESYLNDSLLDAVIINSDYIWFDTGTHENLLEAAIFVKDLQEKQSILIGCPEEIALVNGWITQEELEKQIHYLPSNGYGNLLRSIIK